ncbi:MAG: DUF1801 domain-containing protein, partial [Chitinophagaceae bacterium]
LKVCLCIQFQAVHFKHEKMEATAVKFKTVEEYLSAFPDSTKKLLKELRRTIKESAPDAEELISYNMPAYKLHGALVYFAAYKGHIGFYPITSGIRAFEKELSAYEGSKGTVKFPLDKPLPLKLISRIVKYRVKENLEKAAAKSKKKK